MNNEIREMLEEEIKDEFLELSELQAGSKEQAEAITNLAALYKLKIDDDKVQLEVEEKLNNEQLKLEDRIERNKDRYIRLGMEGAGIVLPLIFYAIWMRKGFKFEEKGTYTSTTFRGLFNRFRPTK